MLLRSMLEGGRTGRWLCIDGLRLYIITKLVLGERVSGRLNGPVPSAIYPNVAICHPLIHLIRAFQTDYD